MAQTLADYSAATTASAEPMTEAWAVAGHAIDIMSITAASVATAIIVGCIIWDRTRFVNRVAFRLTLWIAVSSIVYSSCRVHQYNNTATVSGAAEPKPESGMRLRVAAWLMVASELCAVLVCTLVSAHLVTTVCLHKLRLAGRVQRWYDILAVCVSLAVSHPVLYVYHAVAWDPRLQAVAFNNRLLLDTSVAWAVYLAWCAAGVVVCLGVSGFVGYRSVVPRTPYVLPLKAGHQQSSTVTATSSTSSISQPPKTLESAVHPWGEELSAPYTGLQHHSNSNNSNSGGTATQSATLRVACYGLLPLATQIWPLAYALSRGNTRQPSWLYKLAHVAPSTQGILCLLLLVAANPACDALWPAVWEAVTDFGRSRRRAGRDQGIAGGANGGLGAPGLALAFARLGASSSTIHLSPYQSRQTSMII
ncbi:hypothetical protein IWW48_002955 [Coemansia sp. RSA 1200]|nr:hypothetical protein IWW48_002955 [Coemansia sp. RSA 1200]